MTINIAPLNVAKQIGLPGLDIKNDASLMDFSAPSFSPVLSAFYDLIDGKVREIFLYGDSGVGKTHLLSALQRQYLSMPTNKTNNQAVAIFLSFKEIIAGDVEVLSGLELFSLILIDDIDLIIQRRDWQEALFHLINRARSNNAKLIYTASCPPSELNFDLLDLSTRLAQALSFALPNGSHRSDRQALLESILNQKGWQLPDTIKEHFVNEGPHHVGDMLQVLPVIMPYFNRRGRKLSQKTLDEIKAAIQHQSLMVELADIDISDNDNLNLPL